MGKSATATLLRGMGIRVFDSDACVHDLLGPNGKAVPMILARFPEVAGSNGRGIDRKKLGQIVFYDEAARRDLEAILHPLVWKAQRHFIGAAKRAGQKQIVLDIPLLFETGSDRKCDTVLCVTAPRFIQRQRVLSRPFMTEEKFQGILRGQMPDVQKRHLADHVIQTGLGRAFALQSLKKLVRSLKK